ncbi:MAG: histidine kinase [Ilumatobacteraceae bacterium]
MARTVDASVTAWPTWLTLVGVPAAVLGIGVLGTLHIGAEDGQRDVDALAVALVVVCSAVLIGRRRWPLATLVVVVACAVTYILFDYPGGPIFLAIPVALYSFALASERKASFVAAGVVTVVLDGVRIVVQRDVGPEDLLLAGWAAATVLAADAMRGRRERAVFLEERRDEETRRRMAEDRLRIARDLHDSVAHSMATINVQSGVAAHVLDRNPAQATVALEAIRIASRDVLDELAAMLGVLRDEPTADRAPTPDLRELDGLIASSRRAGLTVSVTVDGDVDDASPAVSMAAYRVVQEALTNVIRHAGTSSATVSVAVDGRGQLAVEVLDDGRGSVTGDGTAGTGMGLRGVRERAAITGGACDIGPRPAGGFRVAVRWPGRET